jgi:hypothetical protein
MMDEQYDVVPVGNGMTAYPLFSVIINFLVKNILAEIRIGDSVFLNLQNGINIGRWRLQK